MKDMVLVTGADGFVGRHVVKVLLNQGYRVRALDRSFQHAAEDGAERVEVDILDAPLLKTMMEDIKTVFHLAAITSLWMPDENAYHTVNVEGTRRVLAAAVDAGADRFVYCSSFVTTISGPRVKRTIDESIVPEPPQLFGAYARSKRRAERLVMESGFRIEPVIVLPSAPIGPGDHNFTAPTAFLRDLVNGKIPAFIEQVTNFIDVRILAEAIVAAGEKGKPGQRYLLTGANRDIREFLALVEKLSGTRMPSKSVPYGLAATASFIEEKIICRLLKRPPKAPYAGVRMAGRPFEFDHGQASFEFDLDMSPIDEAIMEALSWLRKHGHIDEASSKAPDDQE